jgi:type VI secretion system protein ImpM
MPSVDRIGRYYPLSIRARLCPGQSPFDLATSTTGWFEHIETLALSCLREGFDFAIFDAELAAASLPPVGSRTRVPTEQPNSETRLASEVGGLLGRLLEGTATGYSLWWTSGPRTIAGCCRAHQGLPPSAEFGRLLR